MTIQIKKVSVKLVQLKLYSITLNLLYLDGTIELINQDFSCKYRTGENVDNIINKFKGEMQLVINNYKAEQTIFNATVFDNAIVALKNGLVA